MKTSINEKAIEKAIQDFLPVLIERGELPVDLTASRSGRGWIATIQLQDEQIKDAIRASVAPMFNLSGSVSIDVSLVGTRGDYRVLLPSENASQADALMDSADRKMRRARKLLSNTPPSDTDTATAALLTRVAMRENATRRGLPQ